VLLPSQLRLDGTQIAVHRGKIGLQRIDIGL
jgi:hypothetical protein